MNFLLDTNVLCEPLKPRPDPHVIAWLNGTDEDRLFLSAVTLAEVYHGIERLPTGSKRDRLRSWVDEDLVERFGGRILDVDRPIAEKWGAVMAEAEAGGRPVNSLDGFIAATARHHNLTVVTGNVSDFGPMVSPILNPWADHRPQ